MEKLYPSDITRKQFEIIAPEFRNVCQGIFLMLSPIIISMNLIICLYRL